MSLLELIFMIVRNSVHAMTVDRVNPIVSVMGDYHLPGRRQVKKLNVSIDAARGSDSCNGVCEQCKRRRCPDTTSTRFQRQLERSKT